MLCDVCKSKEAVIHITGEGDFCAACHNRRMLDRFLMTNDAVHADHVSVAEPDGAIHTFHVQHLILGAIVSWEAVELTGKYEVRWVSRLSSELQDQVSDFYQRIVESVMTKTVKKQESEHWISNLLPRDGQFYSLADKGTVFLKEADSEAMHFVADGEEYTAEEFARMLGHVQGFQLQYQIVDAADTILREDEYLMPVTITKQSLVKEMQELIDLTADNGFADNRMCSVFEHFARPIIDRANYLFSRGGREEAMEAAEIMIQMLQELRAEDPAFPEQEITLLQDLLERIF